MDPFLDAVERGDAAKVASLLDHGADPNSFVDRTESLYTGESVESYRWATIRRRETALELALRCRRRAVAEALLQRGARATADALWHAVRNKDQELVRRLLDGGADPNERVWTIESVNEDELPGGNTINVHLRVPLMTLASGERNPTLFLLLAAAGGKAGKKEYTTMLLWACRSGDVEAVRPVLEAAERAGVTLDPIDVVGQDFVILRFVLEHGWHLHPESAAAEARRVELSRCLMKAVASYPGIGVEHNRWLRETVSYLIAQGADPDFFDPRPHRDHHVSPLHEALRKPFILEMITLLLDHGARTTFVYEDGQQETALDVAKRHLHPDSVPWMAEVLRPYEEARTRKQG